MADYKCIAGLTCTCGKGFNALLPRNSPPVRIGGIDGNPANLGEQIYFHYFFACPQCGKRVAGIVPARDLGDGLEEEKSRITAMIQIGGETQEVPVFFNQATGGSNRKHRRCVEKE